MEKSKKRKVLKKSKEGSGKKPNKKKLDKTVVKDDRYDDSSELESDSVHIQKLLEPFPKEQLIEFICDGAIKDPSLFQRIRDTADRDVAHRKIFVHGLAWDTTRETLISAFQSFGEIEDCNIIIDRATGKTKGYGFVLFKNRSGAAKALKQPRKKISNRVTFCQLASVGPVPASKNQDTTGRKIYVSNVHADVDPEKLRSFFEKFGEIETGPLGFDLYTGKSRRYALFVYRTQEGAKKSLEEPCKVFEGNQLLCQMATENKNNPLVQPVQAPVLAAVAAAQNLAIFRQHPSLNPAFSGLISNPYYGLIAGPVAPMMAGALNPGMIASSQMMGNSMGSAAGLGPRAAHGLSSLEGTPSVLGAYGSTATALQGLHAYQSSLLGQPSSAWAQ